MKWQMLNNINNIIFIQSLLNSVVEKYNGAESQGNENLADRIKLETQNAIEGIKKLQRTYEDDSQFQACMNVSIETVRIHLNIIDSGGNEDIEPEPDI